MHLTVRLAGRMSRRTRVDWSRRDTAKVAQQFIAGLVFKKKRPVPAGTIDGTVILPVMPRDGKKRNWSRDRRALRRRSIVPAGTGPLIVNLYPALKYWATFVASLRDQSARAADCTLKLIASRCVDSDPSAKGSSVATDGDA
jgi:hypothetical protein